MVPGEIAPIRLARPETGEEELAEVAAVLESGMLTQGPRRRRVREELIARGLRDDACARRLVGHGRAPSRGACARPRARRRDPRSRLHVPGDGERRRALRPAPVLVDVDPVTMNIDPEKLTVGPRTKAILAVHLFGRPCRIEELPDLPVIEDAAGALGARRGGRACGSLGLVGCLSFHPAQDRHHRRGRRRDDRATSASRRRWRSSATTAGARSPTPTCRLRGSTTGSPTSWPRSGCPRCGGSTSCSAAARRWRSPTTSGWPACR